MENNKLAVKDNGAMVPSYGDMASGYEGALQVVDDVVLKSYITELHDLDVIPLDEELIETNLKENVIFFKINEMVYEKNEFVAYKFASVFNALAATKSAVFLVVDSNGMRTDFYMGIRSYDDERTTSSLGKILENAMSGQFPGVKTTNYTIEEMTDIVDGFKSASISSVSCVANIREEHQNKNDEFVQGLEKLIVSMSGQKYTGIILANNTDQGQLRSLRKGYESIYTQLSPFASMQVNYGENSSTGQNASVSAGTNEASTDTYSETTTKGKTTTTSSSESTSKSKSSMSSKIVDGVAAATTMVGVALAPVCGLASLVSGGVAAGGLGMAGKVLGSTITNATSQSKSSSVNESTSHGKSHSTAHGSNSSMSIGSSTTQGLSQAVTLTAHDKSVEDLLERIDKQLDRISEFESLGMYECAAYFLSDDQATSEMAAATYKAIMGGENTGLEVSGINTWGIFESKKTSMISEYVKNFMHPVFLYRGSYGGVEVTPCSMVSGNELSLHMGLPRKSVCGLPVIEHSQFGREVVNYDGQLPLGGINLGNVFNMGKTCENNVILDRDSLAMHTFVTGSTGSGKSNTIYELIRQTSIRGAKFMVIEPAKGEYKHVFGNRPDVNVFGTNPQYSEILRINPFKFPKGVHILEHVDRLVEIFNVCWPMYAAMPAVLKDALLKSYEDCGWDFSTSTNYYDGDLFPTFIDLQQALVEVISTSSYSEEVKNNYMGSLVTRVKSLTNGLNGQIFSTNEIDNNILFDENVIIDLSRIGSLETKSLIMGLLIMRLGEHRMSNASGMNIPFKHMTVLEEAHNILKRTSTEQDPENPSVAGKSVEMISNAIAEMRTYGEGFVIVDQSPTAVDISAIRNTNTKIIMRLPDETDRRLAGKSAGLKDEQLDEIAKLPKGVAVVYQNDWVEPVLCKINKFKGSESQYQYEGNFIPKDSTTELRRSLLELLLKTRVNNPIDVNIDNIKANLKSAEIASKTKLNINSLLNDYERRGDLYIWKEDKFEQLAKTVSDLLNGSLWVRSLVETSSEFDVLTDRLLHRIENEVNGLSLEYAVAASQCVMKAEATESDEYKDIYSAWIMDLRDKRRPIL